MTDRITDLVNDRKAAEPEHAAIWDEVADTLRRLEQKPERCSVCGVPSKYFELDCSERCAACTP
jgi:hypothetical protein